MLWTNTRWMLLVSMHASKRSLDNLRPTRMDFLWINPLSPWAHVMTSSPVRPHKVRSLRFPENGRLLRATVTSAAARQARRPFKIPNNDPFGGVRRKAVFDGGERRLRPFDPLTWPWSCQVACDALISSARPSNIGSSSRPDIYHRKRRVEQSLR